MDQDKDFLSGLKLHPDSIIKIKESNCFQEVGIIPIFYELSKEAETYMEVLQSTNNYSRLRKLSLTELNDLTDTESNTVSVVKDRCIMPVYNFTNSSIQDISRKLVDGITDYYNCIHIIVGILSNKDEEMLSRILKEAWKQLSDVEKKKKFIIALMTNDKGGLFCKNVLLHWFQSDESDEIFCSVLPVATLLDETIVKEIALPLLKTDESMFVKEPMMFKEFLHNLNEGQKVELMRSFLCQLKNNISQVHFIPLSLLMDDTTFDEKTIEALLNTLQSSINAYNKDRYIGKLLLTIAVNLELLPSYNLRTFFSQVAEGYKGVARLTLRTKIKALLSIK